MRRDKIRILLADDDNTDRMLFTDALKEIDATIQVNTVNNGEQLMEYLSANTSNLPDLLFLDLNMPRKGGLECLVEIKANQDYKNIAIAIYSTSAAEKDMENTFIHGANIYINKPGDYDVLIRLLKQAIKSTLIYKSPPLNRSNFLLRL